MTDKLNDKALLPCPFCREQNAKIVQIMSRSCVACDCGAKGPSFWHGGPNPDREALNRCDTEAIAAWNCRPSALPAPDDGLEVVAWTSEGSLDILAQHWPMVRVLDGAKEKTPREGTALTRLSDAQAALQSRDETIARLTRERDDALENYTRVWNERDAQRRRAEAAEARELRAMEALEFYADVSKYPAPLTGGMGELWSDCGQIARAALEAQE